jgi:hypothetical protein
MISLLVIEIAVGFATIAFALYRKFLSMHEENFIHLGPGEETYISKQAALARKLHRVDRWGETMTVLTAAGGILLVVLYVYRAWELSLRPW